MAVSTGGASPSCSFLLVSALLSAHHGKDVLNAVHASGLRVEESHSLLLDAVAAERVLRILLQPASPTGPVVAPAAAAAAALAPPSRPSSSRAQRPPSAGAGPSAGAALTAGVSASLSETMRRVEMGGLRLGDSIAIFEMMEERERPSVDEVELFSATAGACAALLLTCVDPRVDVVSRAAELASTLRRRFMPAGSAQHVFAPEGLDSARRGLHWVREAAIRQAAQRGAAAVAAAAAPSTGSSAPLVVPSVGSAATPAAATAAARFSRPPAKHYLVDMDALNDWCFPPHQQFPRSTGRLVLFALHGPLAGGTLLTGGRAGARALTESEVLAMIAEVERDDMLAVYTGGSVVGDVASVLTDVHAASRPLPRMSRDQIAALLADLPRDSRGRCSFHDIQKRVLGARLQRVEDLRLMFAPVATTDRERALAASLRISAPQPLFGRGRLAAQLALPHGRVMAMDRHGGADGAGALATAFTLSEREKSNVQSGRTPSGAPLAADARVDFHVGDPEALPRHSQRLSAAGNVVGGLDIRHKMGPVEYFRVSEGLLHRNTFMLADIDEAARSRFITSMASNTKIIRGDLPGSLDRWDRAAPLALHKPCGTRVPGAGLAKMDMYGRR